MPSTKELTSCNSDFLDVVCCKDCKYLMFSDFYGVCSLGCLGIVSPDDFCSHAERKGSEHAI